MPARPARGVKVEAASDSVKVSWAKSISPAAEIDYLVKRADSDALRAEVRADP